MPDMGGVVPGMAMSDDAGRGLPLPQVSAYFYAVQSMTRELQRAGEALGFDTGIHIEDPDDEPPPPTPDEWWLGPGRAWTPLEPLAPHGFQYRCDRCDLTWCGSEKCWMCGWLGTWF